MKLLNLIKTLPNKFIHYIKISNAFLQLPKEQDKSWSAVWNDACEVQDYLDKITFNPSKVAHIKLEDSANIKQDDRGKAFIREDQSNGKSIFRKATQEEIHKAYFISFGGLDFDNPAYLSSLLKNLQKLQILQNANIGSIDTQDTNVAMIAIFPEVQRSIRYEEAVEFSLLGHYTDYYPDYIETRLREYIIPKIITDDVLHPPKHRIVLLSFSVGGREVLMLENALKVYLRSYNLEEEVVTQFLQQHFVAICVAYAVDPSHIKNCGMQKLIIFSANDHGVLKPQALLDLLTPDICSKKFAVIQLGINQLLLTLGWNTLPNLVEGKEHVVDHGLPHYIHAIHTLPNDVQATIQNIMTRQVHNGEKPMAAEITGESNNYDY